MHRMAGRCEEEPVAIWYWCARHLVHQQLWLHHDRIRMVVKLYCELKVRVSHARREIGGNTTGRLSGARAHAEL